MSNIKNLSDPSVHYGGKNPETSLKRKRTDLVRRDEMIITNGFSVAVGIPSEAYEANKLSLLRQFIDEDEDLNDDLAEEDLKLVENFKTMTQNEIDAEYRRLFKRVYNTKLEPFVRFLT